MEPGLKQAVQEQGHTDVLQRHIGSQTARELSKRTIRSLFISPPR